MKPLLKVPLMVGFFASATYGGCLGVSKFEDYLMSGRQSYIVIAADTTLSLKRVSYSVRGEYCLLRESRLSHAIHAIEMFDRGCDGIVDSIRTRYHQLERDKSNEDLFKKADRKFNKLVKDLGLDARVKGYMDDREKFEGYFPE